MLIRGIYVVVYSTIIIGMFRYKIIIIYEVPQTKRLRARKIGLQHVTRRVTEGRRQKGDRSTKCRVKETTREETCTT